MTALNVIIPCAPHDVSFLPKCLQSVQLSLEDMLSRGLPLVQEAKVRVVFDGHVDNIHEFFKGANHGYHDISYEWCELDQPYGAAIARNWALGLCDPHDLVAFMDADDVVFPWCYHTRLEGYNSMPGARRLAYSQCMYIFHDPSTKKVMKMVRDVPTAENVKGWLEQQNVILTTSILTKAGTLQLAGGFEPLMICGEDGCLWRRVVGLKGIAEPMPIPLVTHSYTQRAESQCRRLHKAHQDMFHLEVPKHGPMGQALDEKAKARADAAVDAQTPLDRAKALTNWMVMAGQQGVLVS